ncbi:MAG TPA: hypothetical protein VM204_06455 [Gaiellaceae bacterium]|nr:hypothetical protein [Gaiellaceae bacterium]
MNGSSTRGGARKEPKRRARVAGWALLVALSFSSAALAQVPGEEIARRAFEEGVALEKKGDFAGALAKFTESEQIKATLGNRYHKAYCLEMTGKLAAALIEYEIVDKAARDTNKPELVEATRLRLEPLRVKVPQLALKLAAAAPRNAEVTLDGAPISSALLDGRAFRIDPGEHVIAARAPDHESFTRSFTAGESTTTSVEITLPRSGAASAPAPAPAAPGEQYRVTEPPAEAGAERSRTLPILTTAGAVVLAAGGASAFLVAAGEQSDLEAACAQKPSCEDDKGATRTFDALALGGFIGAAGLAALSVVLWTSKPSTSASGSARVVARSSWLGLECRF